MTALLTAGPWGLLTTKVKCSLFHLQLLVLFQCILRLSFSVSNKMHLIFTVSLPFPGGEGVLSVIAGTSSTTDRGMVSSASREPAGIVRGVLK